ncbi:MAG: guanitoxin biosynthesis heme-dependent pre-guanitoxin N-hydroxylase GntA [Pseudomonadota bacterium]
MNECTASAERPNGALLAHREVAEDFAAFIRSISFPCVGAKSSLAHGALEVLEAGDIESTRSDHDIHRALLSFGERLNPDELASFACLFRPRPVMSELAFERALWARLQALHDIDAEHGVGWAPDVSRDPKALDFSFSVGGVAYFVIGLHPGSSRTARRFGRPALVFNSHEQFERLRQDGRYEKMQATIRDRELAQAGSINPMVADFGRGREAAQYSGRNVEPGWTCPLKIKT